MIAALATGCSGSDRAVPPPPSARVPAPAPDDDGACADVGTLRVCWPERGAARARPRPLPDRPAPAAGWRCAGAGADRACTDRGRGGGPFECAADECVQRYPRMPDDGEWECIDMAGVVMCRRGVPAAGVVEGPPDPGWLCGARAGARPAERVCVDFAPDLPPGDPARWRCRYDHSRRERRICRKARKPRRLGGACDARRPCPAELACAGGLCLPRAPGPRCWLDGDCGDAGACRLGTCVARGDP